MKMTWKQWGNLVLSGMLAVGIVSSLGNMTVMADEAEGKVLEVEVGYSGEALDNFRLIMDDFTEQTGIAVELVTPGSDYETVMKTRMASGDMPDVFTTHGWSIARYKEYLLELNDQPWFENVSDSIKGVISDEDGKIYVLCVSQAINGIEYNRDVLEKAGIDPISIHTMEDFEDACAKVREIGIDPIFLGGKDYWTSASLMENFAPAFYTAEGCAYPMGEQLKDGSFNWETDGMYYFESLKNMVNNGYFNENFVTADEVQGFEALANGNCAFLVGGVALDRIRSYNEEANIGVMPAPATTENGKSEYLVGEGSAFGIWKDSEYIEEAKQMLEYLAQSEVAERVLVVDEQLPSLNNIDMVDNQTYEAFTQSEEAFAGTICYDNLFDREYLPSGMWSVMSDCVMEVLMDPSDEGVQSAVENMQENYVEKLEAAE